MILQFTVEIRVPGLPNTYKQVPGLPDKNSYRPLEVDGEPDELVPGEGGVVPHHGRHVLAEGALRRRVNCLLDEVSKLNSQCFSSLISGIFVDFGDIIRHFCNSDLLK